jgi:hypothetical protein
MKPELYGMSEEDYNKLKKSGMMGEWYPNATWSYWSDCEVVPSTTPSKSHVKGH